MTLTQARPRRRVASAILGLGAQLLLLGVIPLALWKLSGSPVPRRLPTWAQLGEQWRGIETQPAQIAQPVLRFMADALWIIWAWYAAWTGLAVVLVLLRLPRTILPRGLAVLTPAIAFRALSLGALVTVPAAPAHTTAAVTATVPAPRHRAAPSPAAPTTRRVAPAELDRPHSVGYALPDDAGYIGITLISAVAAAVAILRARNRRGSRPRDHEISDLARRLAVVHSAAESARHYTYRPDEHPGETPPPLYEPAAGHVGIATSPDGRHEIPFTPDALSGPLILTGPGAPDAARALAINALANGTVVDADPELDDVPGTPGSTSTRIRAAHPGIDYEPGTVVLGTPDPQQNATILDIDRDGTLRAVTGPAASVFAGARIHTLDPDAAGQLHKTLKDTRPIGPQANQGLPSAVAHPTTGRNHPVRSDEPQFGPDETARALASTPLILRVLGEPDLLTRTDGPIRVGTEQAAAILTILALHPDGINARELRALEWPETADDRRARLTLASAMNRVRTRLRDALASAPGADEPLVYDRLRKTYRLNPDVVTTDLALIQSGITRADAAADTAEQLHQLARVAALHRARLAAYVDDHRRDWLTTARYNLLNQAAGIHLRIAELAASTRPAVAAGHLTAAVELIPEDPGAVASALRTCRQMHQLDLAQTIYRMHADALRLLGETPDPDTDSSLAARI